MRFSALLLTTSVEVSINACMHVLAYLPDLYLTHVHLVIFSLC